MPRKPRRRDVAIVEMAAWGISPQVLAVLTGMSATRVRQIIRAAPASPAPEPEPEPAEPGNYSPFGPVAHMLGAVFLSEPAGSSTPARDDHAAMRINGQRISHADVPPHIRDEMWRQHHQRFGMTDPDAPPEALNSPPRYLDDPKPVEVDGYRRADGTYVRPYRRRR